MREIKFRQWNPKNKRFQYDIGITGPGSWSGPSYCTWDKYPLEQLTGLIDKNGKEIYEGDILGTDCAGKMISAVMTWEECDSGWAKFSPLSCFEVVGNIHENPEISTI